MKRLLSIFLVTALMLSLVAPMAVAEKQSFGDLEMEIDVPDGYEATQVEAQAISGKKNIPVIDIQNKDKAEKRLQIFVDSLLDSDGKTITLEQAGNLWRTKRINEDLHPTRTDDGTREGYYSIKTDTADGKDNILCYFYDSTVDSRIKTGQYFAYVYRTAMEEAEVDKIIASISVNGSASSGGNPATGGGGTMGSSGGGGCVAGSSALAMLGALVVFMKARKR